MATMTAFGAAMTAEMALAAEWWEDEMPCVVAVGSLQVCMVITCQSAGNS